MKEGESVVTLEEHIMISDDKNHDKYAVKAFEQASLDHLKEKGFTPTHSSMTIVQVSINQEEYFNLFRILMSQN